MSLAIPPGKEITAVHSFARVTKIEEAAMLLAEDGHAPWPDRENFIRKFQRGKQKPFHEFRFVTSKDQKFIAGAFHRPDEFCRDYPDHHVAKVILFFEERKRLRALLDRPGNIRDFEPGFAGVVIRDLKLAAAIRIADAAAPFPAPDDFVRRQRDTKGAFYVFQFEPTPALAEIQNAFAAPDTFVAAHREDWLSYVIRAAYLRERLLDSMMKVPTLKVIQRINKRTGKPYAATVPIPPPHKENP